MQVLQFYCSMKIITSTKNIIVLICLCYNYLKEESVELKKQLNPKYIFVGLYILFFAVYIIMGLQPAEAVESYNVSAHLDIPSIGLSSAVTKLKLENHQLKTPETIVGSFSRAENKTLLIGHSSTVFQNLNQAHTGDEIVYNDAIYKIYSTKIVEKSEVNMNELLKAAQEDTLVIMTCAGTELGDGDATHRLIVTAIR